MATHISTRYFILLLPNKEISKDMNNKIEVYVNNILDLELNKKTKYYPSRYGIDFCGYKVFETHILLRKRFKIKYKKNIKLWKKLYSENRLNMNQMKMSLNSFLAHASHSNSYNFLKSLNDVRK